MCVGSEFQVDGAETENAREVKLLVMPEGLARRFVLEERNVEISKRILYHTIAWWPLLHATSAVAELLVFFLDLNKITGS